MTAGYSLPDFAFDLRRHANPDQAWVSSGWTAVRAVPGTVCGAGGCFAPPYAAPDSALTVTLEVDGRPVDDGVRPGIAGFGRGVLSSGGTWRPDRIERSGTFHQYGDGGLVSLAVRSRLTPRHGAGGYTLEVTVGNRADREAEVRLLPRLSAGRPMRVPLAEWGWMPPRPEDPATGAATLTLTHGTLEARIPAGGSAGFVLGVELGTGGTPTENPADWARDATARWERRLGTALAAVPRLETDIPGLDAYWRRSLASGLVCLWDNPSFVTSPFVATSGIDGGALCAYMWDTGGYAPNVLALMLGDTATDLLEALLKADLTQHYAIAPDGTGLGVAYAYSGWSLVTLTTAVAAQRGIAPGLVERLHDTIAALDARFPAAGELRDYGTQHNLLEMRGAGWEHVVASPNAERAGYLDALAALAEASGAVLPVADLRATAGRVRAAVAAELWDPQARWFRSRYPDGHTELAYSIQAYDALRAGACTPDMAEALLDRIRPGAFLGTYGVSSVSAEDERHYELGDTDWSGGGAYTGEAPQLALTLWELGRPALAWTVLSRLLWMGEHYPYFPQEHYADRPAAPPTGRRANVIAGLTGAEAILLGLAGIRPRPDGGLLIAPPPPPGNLTLQGLRWRGRTIDVECTPTGTQVTVDGHAVSPAPVVLPAP
ncbi:MGH1-like glycoside hydrolase domain-containing protein [Dactylosporangium sp. CA-092794]|uniref:MGH1-like glycoside hydrolase domain-containing protein n=1 Tax=Dactylosporangium sp. CA-092794 TaxID=3239929 RepID=UPI003D913F18